MLFARGNSGEISLHSISCFFDVHVLRRPVAFPPVGWPIPCTRFAGFGCRDESLGTSLEGVDVSLNTNGGIETSSRKSRFFALSPLDGRCRKSMFAGSSQYLSGLP